MVSERAARDWFARFCDGDFINDSVRLEHPIEIYNDPLQTVREHFLGVHFFTVVDHL